MRRASGGGQRKSAAVVLFPYSWDGARKLAAATAALDALLGIAGLFVVVVDQEALLQSALSASTTTAGGAQLAEDAACGAVLALLAAESRAETTLMGGFPPGTAAVFGEAPLTLSPDADDATAAAAISAALTSAASTPFVAGAGVNTRAALACHISCTRQLAGSVINAASAVAASALPAGALVTVAQVPPAADGRGSVRLFVMQEAGKSRWAQPVEAAAPAAPRTASAVATPQRHWAALSKLAGGVMLPQQEAMPSPQEAMPPPPAAAPVRAPPQLPDDAPEDDFFGDDAVDNGMSEVVQPAQRQSRGLPFLRWGSREEERTVSQRASAVLASDRAASRTVVRLEYADGSTYEGEMRAGREEGTGRRVYANGHWYAGEWKDGLRHGWGVSQTASGRYEGLWESGRPVDRATAHE